MICYICSNPAINAVAVDRHQFAYCEAHSADVQLGAIEFNLKGKLDRLIIAKQNFKTEQGSASAEFDKYKDIIDHRHDDDSSVTEQGL